MQDMASFILVFHNISEKSLQPQLTNRGTDFHLAEKMKLSLRF